MAIHPYANKFLKKWQKLYHNDPVGFAEKVIGIKLSDQQKLVFNKLIETTGDVSDHRLACKSGHGTGKSALQSIAILWFMCTRPYCRIVCTAPTAHQLMNVLWAEVGKWYRKSKFLYDLDLFRMTKERLCINVEKIDKSWFTVPVSVSKPDNLQGFHEEDILIILDESSGIDSEIMEVVEGALTTKGAFLLTMGNPTKTSGMLYDLFNKYKDFYKLVTLNSEDSPNADQKQIKFMEEKYGRDSDVYRVRVLGEFPNADAYSIMSRTELEKAVRDRYKVVRYVPDVDIHIGVDVASLGGDRTVVSVVQGGVEIERIVWKAQKIPVSARKVCELACSLSDNYLADVKIKVDSTGLGIGFSELLEEYVDEHYGLNEIEVYPINFSFKANDTDKYSSIVSEMYFEFSENIERLSILNDEETENFIDEITKRLFNFDERNRFKVEKKKEYIRREGKSPDLADAIILAFYDFEAGELIKTDLSEALRKPKINKII